MWSDVNDTLARRISLLDMAERSIKLESLETPAPRDSRPQNVPNHAELIDCALEMSIEKARLVHPGFLHVPSEPPSERDSQPRESKQATTYAFNDSPAFVALR
jgi:hypothetical protein